MNDENRKDWEKRLWSEVQELRMIQDDIKALRQHLDDKPAEFIIPEFIMDPQIRAEAAQLLKFAEKYETFDILDVFITSVNIRNRLYFFRYRQIEDQILKNV